MIGTRAAAAPAPVVHVVVAGEVGGAERMVLSLARPPRGAGARRHVIALWSEAPAVRALFTDAGVDVVTPPEAARHRLMKRDLLRDATGGRDVAWLAEVVRSLGARAVQLHTFASHVLGTRAGLMAGVPVIRTEHSTRVYDHWLCRPFSRWSLRRAAAVVTVSDDLRRQVCAQVPAVAARVSVIRNGVPLPGPGGAPPAPSGSGPLRIGVIGRLEPRKGVDRAIAALAGIAGVVLDVVGDGPSRAALERQVARLGLGERVRFWGYRSDPETIVAETDAVLCSSHTEGLPVALLEAMALGRPVIAVPVGGVPEIVGDGESGWLAQDRSDGALAAALRDAAALGRAEMARRGARARAAIEQRFTEAHMRERYEQIYRTLTWTWTGDRGLSETASARARRPARGGSSRSLA